MSADEVTVVAAIVMAVGVMLVGIFMGSGACRKCHGAGWLPYDRPGMEGGWLVCPECDGVDE